MVDGGLSAEDRDALQAYLDEWVNQCLDRDWDTLVERLTDDVVFMPPDEPAVIGKAAAADFFEAYPIITAFSASSRAPTDVPTMRRHVARSI